MKDINILGSSIAPSMLCFPRARRLGLMQSRCYCGNTLAHDSAKVPENVCKSTCSGSYGSVCGGSGALSLYESSDGDGSTATP